MPPPTVRNRVPRVRTGVPDLTRLDRAERAVLTALYAARPFGVTFADLACVTRLGKAALTRALKVLADPTRCARLGVSVTAIERTERDDRDAVGPGAPAPLYTVTAGWLLTRRA